MTINIQTFQFASRRFHFTLLEEKHRSFYQSLYTDKVVMEKIAAALDSKSVSTLFDQVLRKNTLSLTANSRSLYWVIVDSETGNYLGIQGFIQTTTVPQEAEFGIMLAQTNYQKGIANESISALIRFGFEHLKFENLFAHYTKQNAAIQRIAENLNFNIKTSGIDSEDRYCWMTDSEFRKNIALFKGEKHAAR